MIVSHTHKFIFVAIPKTGTHAVRFALRPYLGNEDWEQVGLFKHSQLPIVQIAQKKHGHISVSEIQPYLSNEQWETYLKYSIVRNPWDRFISYCFFKMKKRMDMLSSNPIPFMKLMISHDKNFKADILSKPQTDFLKDTNGEIKIDFLLHQENLQHDYNLLVNKLGLGQTTLEVVNASEHKNYREYYDDELKEMVETYYQEDIKTFNYKF